MAAKVIGFNSRIALKGMTAAEIKKCHTFKMAAAETAAKLHLTPEQYDSLLTVRQAAKFRRGAGLVYNTAMKSN